MFSKYRLLKQIAKSYDAPLLVTHWHESNYLVVATPCFAVLALSPNVPEYMQSLDSPQHLALWSFVHSALAADYTQLGVYNSCDILNQAPRAPNVNGAIFCNTFWQALRLTVSAKGCREVFVYYADNPKTLLLQPTIVHSKSILLLINTVASFSFDNMTSCTKKQSLKWYERIVALRNGIRAAAKQKV